MSGGPYLAELKKKKVKDSFLKYKTTSCTLKDIANDLELEQSTIGKYLTKFFGDEYARVAKLKSHKHRTIVTDDQMLMIFKRYKKGEEIKKLASEFNITFKSLKERMRKKFGSEYKEIAKVRYSEQMHQIHTKVSKKEIKRAFNNYKHTTISLTELGNELGIAESSLISRFKKDFGVEYKRIALARRDERKVTKKMYIEAFDNYKSTNISLPGLAEKLSVRISSLRSRFINLFGDEYLEIASRKLDGIFLIRKERMQNFWQRNI